MNAKRRRPTGLEIVILGGVVLIVSCLLEWPLSFLFGWVRFLARVGPNVTVSAAGFGTGLLCFAGFVGGLHLMGAWLTRASGSETLWRARWTVALALLVIVTFAAGIAGVGMAHQVGWLVRSPEPLWSGKERPARSKSSNNLKQLVLAAHLHNDSHQGQFLPGYTIDLMGNPQHGWLALALLYLEYQDLHSKIHFDLPWSADKNRQAFETRIPTFLVSHPHLAEREDGYAVSHYAGNTHVLTAGPGLRFPADFKDGTSNTLFAGEVAAGFRPWGHPLNLRDPARGIRPTPDAFASPRGYLGTLFAMADGSVRDIKSTISPVVLRALATPAGGDDPGTNWDQ